MVIRLVTRSPYIFVSVLFLAGMTGLCVAQSKAAEDAAPDVLVLNNGDTLHGKFVNAIGGKVSFHSDPLGDISVSLDKVKELHTGEKLSVLDKTVKLRGKEAVKQIPTGTVDVAGENVTVRSDMAAAPVTIPVKNAQYIVDAPTLNRQLLHEPSFFTGWNGAATAGATLVQATQNQYTVSGSLGLIRAVPSVAWLNPRNRTSADFSGSYGKITEPGTTPLKSAIYHIDGERDQYLSSRFFALAQTAFDHNFSQDLQLQQIYGGGVGWTFLKSEAQEADVKGTIQYEKQQFINGTSGTNQNLIGSTFALSYAGHAKVLTIAQSLQFIPAYNTPSAYSASETDTVTFPAYKNFGFSVGTIDTYLNNPPASTPPTKRNSFQFTMGLTYAFKSKY
jgi:hypothetical protein